MKFDKSKILTCGTAEQARVGDVGWFADSISKMKRTVQEDQPLKLAHIEGEDKVARFSSERCNLGWHLFYPAPYEYFQAKWVKKNRLKVGDKVIITKEWRKGEHGFEYSMACQANIGGVYIIRDVLASCLLTIDEMYVPYFAIEKVEKVPEPTHRPFTNAEEFKPYRERWFVSKKDSDVFRVELYCDSGIYEVRGYWSYDELYKDCTLEDGTPAGVKL